MGYDIKLISDLETFDYSLCSGISTKDTVRKSNDGNYFIVEGDSFTTYTQEQMLEIVKDENWSNNINV